MTSLLPLLLSLAPSAPPAAESEAGTTAVAAAEAVVLQRGRDRGVELQAQHVGRIPHLPAAFDGARWSAQLPIEQWLRPRVPVTVSAVTESGATATVTVWFAVSAPTPGAVYAADASRGTPASELQLRAGNIDLARTHGERPMASPGASTAGRLRRAVRAGEPALASDLEAVPAVAARQRITLEAVAGPVRLLTAGTALSDGNVGQVIAVLPDHAAQPVKGRVVSPEAVRIER
jgi:flagella basal body P-ring formation protein FlgA